MHILVYLACITIRLVLMAINIFIYFFKGDYGPGSPPSDPMAMGPAHHGYEGPSSTDLKPFSASNNNMEVAMGIFLLKRQPFEKTRQITTFFFSGNRPEDTCSLSRFICTRSPLV